MSILKRAGLTEEQIKGILSGEIERLTKQEASLKASVDELAGKYNEFFEKRQKAAEQAESLKLEMAEAEKKNMIRIGEFRKIEEKIEDQKKQLSIREDKIRSEKEALSKERSIHINFVKANEDLLEDVKTEQKKLAEKQAKLNEDYELLEAKKIQIDNDWNALKDTEKEIETRIKLIEIKDADLKKQEDALSAERSKMLAKVEEEKKKSEDYVAGVDKKNLETQADFEAQREVLKKRELDIIRREKAIQNQEISLKSREENFEIKEANLQGKKESGKKK